MRKNLFFMATTLLAAIVMGCGGGTADRGDSKNDSVGTTMPGDSTVYGLACDGCTDTILVLLRDVTRDPDTFDILDASRNQHVYGHPRIGDQMAVVLAKDSTNVAAMVVDIDKILGAWCYTVTPTLRRRADIDKGTEQELLKKLPDSIVRRLLQPREYGFELKNDFQAQPIGIVRQGNTSDDRSPVEYPELKRYREWHLHNGRLVLYESEQRHRRLRTAATRLAGATLPRR